VVSPRISLEQVRFSYGQAPVLEDVSLAAAPGEMLALLGPNGSGKSTLLGLVAGIRRPTAGRVLLDGQELGQIPPRARARRIALVGQTASVPFAFTVREWVSLGRTPYLSPLRGEQTADRAAIGQAMDAAEVTGLADRLVGEISGGERQRAALALALAQEPDVLLLDEATAHLDLHHQASLLGLVRRLNEERGLTVLAALHDPNLAALWFDRLVLLHDRRVLADGPGSEVLTEETLERAFQAQVRVIAHPTRGVPLVVPDRR